MCFTYDLVIIENYYRYVSLNVGEYVWIDVKDKQLWMHSSSM